MKIIKLIPSDFQGGLLMFAIMFGIALVQIYVFKNVKAFKAEKTSEKESLVDRLWTAIGDPSPTRFEKRGVVTATGTVVGKEPHYNSDGDLVFGLMPDPEYEHLLTPESAAHTISGGGLWCEAVCQKENTSKEPVHFNDCKRGAPFPIFPMPELGERWSVTGLHLIDIREGGHAEIHPITAMRRLDDDDED